MFPAYDYCKDEPARKRIKELREKSKMKFLRLIRKGSKIGVGAKTTNIL